jgi:DNA-directed RNA polymerase specialized sigma24 family protein
LDTKRLIDLLADKHQDWINMAKSFGVSDDGANELVQQMYIRIHKYVEEKEKILFREDEVNTFYIYVTLRNLYLSKFHEIGSGYFVMEEHREPAYELVDWDSEEKFDRLVDKIDSVTGNWYWYDKKLWDVYFYWKKSMRDIAKETKISLSSIFNTLTNGKAKIREEAKKEYQDYKKSRED